DNVVSIGLDSVYRFVEKVVVEVKRMYAEAEASLEAVHIGGDEVPAGVWAESPACHRRMAQAGIADRTGLQDDFIRRILDILHRQGLSPACWEEIALIGGLLGHAGGPE